MTDDPKRGHDLEGIFARDAERKRQKEGERKEMTLRQYIELVAQDPAVAQSSQSRLDEIIQAGGVEAIPEDDRWLGVDKRYSLFSNELFGIEDAVHKLVMFISAAKNRASTGGQVLLLVGPPATGKSTLVRILMKALEAYRGRPVFGIKGCPKHEEPLHALPRYMRDQIALKPKECPEYPDCKDTHLHLGVKIDGDLCHQCRHRLDTEFKDPDGVIRWPDLPVETFTFSIQGVRGIASFEPSDEKGSDITALSGRENISITSQYGYNHPLAYELSGEIPKAERGLFEARELLSCDREILKVFFSVAQERELKVQGSNFPHVSVDVFVVGHTNLAVFKKFATNKDFEGLHDRFHIIPIAYPLQVSEEVRLLRKLIEHESDFVRLRKCHIAPGSLELAATFAVMTRLTESKLGVGMLAKARIYDGDITDIAGNAKVVDVRQLRDEGHPSSDISKWEGMFGVSSRTVLDALNNTLAEEADRDGCLTPLLVIQALRKVFDHRMGYSPEEVERYRMFLSSSGSDSVMTLYQRTVTEVVTKAYIRGYQDLARELFDRYIREVELYRSQKRRFIKGQSQEVKRDALSGKVKEPDLKFMRSVEEFISWNEQEAESARGELLEQRSSQADFGYDTYPALAKAVERKLVDDSKGTLTLVLATDRPQDDEAKRRASDLYQGLLESGHCPTCAREAVEKAREFLSM